MVVAFHTSIHYCLVSLFPDALSCNIGIDPVRVAPHARSYFAKLHRRTGVIQYCLLERSIEIAIVEKYVWIVEPSIEVPLHRLNGLDDSFKLLIPG